MDVDAGAKVKEEGNGTTMEEGAAGEEDEEMEKEKDGDDTKEAVKEKEKSMRESSVKDKGEASRVEARDWKRNGQRACSSVFGCDSD